jgi:hypothetical protein
MPPGHDHSALLRKAEAASAKLDVVKAAGSNPFEILAARREAEAVMSELAAVAKVDHAHALFKASLGAPLSLFEASPGAVPTYQQSTNAGSSPRGSRVPVYDASGSIAPPGTFPQSENYGRPDGSNPGLEEQRRYAERPDSSVPLETERVLQHLKLLGRVDPPKNYSEGERETMAQAGHAMRQKSKIAAHGNSRCRAENMANSTSWSAMCARWPQISKKTTTGPFPEGRLRYERDPRPVPRPERPHLRKPSHGCGAHSRPPRGTQRCQERHARLRLALRA